MSQNTLSTKMTAIADEIRELSGTTEALGLDAMATNLGEANDEVASQTGLLARVISALDGKASGGSGSVETCTVQFINGPPFINCHYTDGNTMTVEAADTLSNYAITVPVNSIIAAQASMEQLIIYGQASILRHGSGLCAIAIYGDCQIGVSAHDPT